MADCLGLYIEENIIKYAKISEDNNIKKIDTFGIKFYENLEETIKQIIEETYSYKVPISINLDRPEYNFFEVFGMLSKKDRENLIDSEFENICYDKSINKDTYEQRYIYLDSTEDKERLKVLHISAQKTDVAHQKNRFSNYKLYNIEPIELSIANLLNQEKDENALIVNIENETNITIMKNNTVKDIKKIPFGSKEILRNISNKENSLNKSYEICKNSTIYTNDAKDLQNEENEYLEEIMPTLYSILQTVQQIVDNSIDKINKIYITGTMAVVNNIDIYFQDYFRDIKCEILKPYFISNNSKVNIKDYIEVNSAIAIALQGIKKNPTNTNFIRRKKTVLEVLNTKIALPKGKKIEISPEKLVAPINMIETVIIITFISYIAVVCVFNRMLNSKKQEIATEKQKTTEKISMIQSYNSTLTERNQRFETLIRNIELKSEKASENKRFKNAIPNLLNNISTEMPKGVEIDSIENVSDEHIIIVATATQYEQLGFFKAKLENEKILTNVISDSGVITTVKDTLADTIIDYITITIEGDLP